MSQPEDLSQLVSCLQLVENVRSGEIYIIFKQYSPLPFHELAAFELCYLNFQPDPVRSHLARNGSFSNL